MTLSARRRTARNAFYLIFGSLLGALAVNILYTPLKLTMGGVSGIASIVFQKTGQGDFLPFGVLVLLLNLPLFALGWWKIGHRFVLKSLIGTLVYSLTIDLTAPLFGPWFARYLDLPTARGPADPLIFCLVGGIVYGLGVGFIIRGGYTTGGSDILGIILFRRLRHFSIGKILLAFDVTIVLSTFFFYQEQGLLLILYSLVAMYLTAWFTDVAIDGLNNKRTLFIISEENQAIAHFVLNTLERGATFLPGQGAYSGEERDVLMVVLAHRQVPLVKDFVMAIDPRAFMVVSDSREVMGEGFERDIAEFL